MSATALFGTGCRDRSPDHVPKAFDGSSAQAESALRDLGGTDFEVVEFRVEGGEYKFLPDAFRFGSSLYDMRFTAQLRCTRDLRLPPRTRILETHRESGAPARRVERDLALLRLLGDGDCPAGRSVALQGSAVFEEVESGWRLAAVDRRWRLVPQ